MRDMTSCHCCGIRYATGGSIDRCWSSADISGGRVVGGLAGYSDVGKAISLSYATGTVSAGNGSAVGGLVGETFGTIATSYATGSVSGEKTSSVGGFVGGNAGGAISNGYATGAATGPFNTGGFLGYNNGTVQKSYSAGLVSSNATYAGGFTGYDNANAGSLRKTYWDTTTSGIDNLSQGAGNVPNDPGITGESNDQLQSALPKGFSPKIWGLKANVNGGLPYLLANPPN